jgi:hypothetical protein
LLAPYLKKIPVQIKIGSHALPENRVVFREKREWVKALNVRTSLSVPEALRDLAAGHSEFRWYQALTQKTWSGRLRGLEICKANAAGSTITFKVGQAKQDRADSELRTAFLHALTRPDPMRCGLEESRKIIARLCSVSEHGLEFQVLSGEIPVPINSVTLVPVERNVPCQFPALWWPGDRRRHIDALMRDGRVPWVAELKVASSGQGNNYWEGVVQAALYRAFIKSADWLEDWFKSRDLDRSRCAAALVVPKLQGKDEHERRAELNAVARIFDVKVVEVRWPRGSD